MKARIIYDGSFWIGEVEGTFETVFMGIYFGEWSGWKQVTDRCWTKFGAKLQLAAWKKKNLVDEFLI